MYTRQVEEQNEIKNYLRVTFIYGLQQIIYKYL